jgi:hypothetical protein
VRQRSSSRDQQFPFRLTQHLQHIGLILYGGTRWRPLLALLGTVAGGCFSPRLDIDDCEIPCINACPEDFECRNGYCVRSGSTNSCQSSGDGGGDGHAGASDASIDGPPSVGTPDVSLSDAVQPEVDASTAAEEVPSLPDVSPDAMVPPTPDASVGDAPGDAGIGDTTDGSVADRDVSDASADVPGTPISDAGDGDAPVVCAACSFTDLPRPCRDHPYNELLRVMGGTPPYRWSASLPDGLSMDVDASFTDQSRVFIHGTLTGSGNLAFTVIDGADRQASRTFALPVRDKCWLAYVSLEASSPQLHLVDPILSVFAAPTLAHNQQVNDFQFSPDGRYLAYRFGVQPDNPNSGHLSLVDLFSGQEQALQFSEDAVTHYTWSKDAAVLAVAFQAQSNSSLGGIRISSVADAGPLSGPPATQAADGGIPAVAYLQAVPASVDSDLLWFGANSIAFQTVSLFAAPLLTSAYASLDSDRFENPSMVAQAYRGPVQQRASAAGFFVIVTSIPSDVLFDSLADGPPVVINNDLTNVIAPSGMFTAGVSNNQLNVFRAVDDTSLDMPMATSLEACPMVLTWARDRERLACVTDLADSDGGQPYGEVRIFDLNNPSGNSPMTPDAGSSLQESALGGACKPPISPNCSASEYDYTVAKASSQRRALSPGGRWLAFTTVATPESPEDDYLYWADLASEPKVIKRKDRSAYGSLPNSNEVDIAFSSDEKLILEQRGSFLAIHELTLSAGQPNATGIFVASGLVPPLPCSEDYASAPDRWCGNIANAAVFKWSSDPNIAAFKTMNALTTVEFAFPSSTPHRPFTMVDCNDQCSGQFAFQP